MKKANKRYFFQGGRILTTVPYHLCTCNTCTDVEGIQRLGFHVFYTALIVLLQYWYLYVKLILTFNYF